MVSLSALDPMRLGEVVPWADNWLKVIENVTNQRRYTPAGRIREVAG
jgi:hypothetical protein